MTVGHSTHPIDAFRESLHDAGVRQVADVRRFPGSRRHPQYGAAALTAALREVGIGYEHVAALGGRRPVLPGSCNGGWQTAGFPRLRRPRAHRHFAEGLARLEELAAERRVAVMCAETLVALPTAGSSPTCCFSAAGTSVT